MTPEKERSKRRGLAGVAAVFLLVCGGWVVIPRCTAEETLELASGGEYLGNDQGQGNFKTCGGSVISYDKESGDKISSTDETCPAGDDLPNVTIQPERDEPPPR